MHNPLSVLSQCLGFSDAKRAAKSGQADKGGGGWAQSPEDDDAAKKAGKEAAAAAGQTRLLLAKQHMAKGVLAAFAGP